MKLIGNLVLGVAGIALAILWLVGLVPIGWWACIVFALAGIRSLADAIIELDERRSSRMSSRDDGC